MPFPDSTTIAPNIAGRVVNKAAAVSATNKVRNGWLIGTYDPAKTTVVPDVPKQYLSASQVGDELGFGFPCHRLALNWEKQGKGVNMWITPQDEDGSAVQAEGTITVTVTTAVAGTISQYIADDLVEVGVTDDQADAAIATAIAAAINADPDLPVTAAAALGVVTVTAKAGGTYGNGVTLADSLLAGQALPGGVSLAYVAMASGATDPDLDDALAGNGTGDAVNGIDATDGVFSYAYNTSNFGKASVYNGLGDQSVGCWAPTVGRPMRFFSVDTTPEAAGFTAMKAITDVNLNDRTNAYIAIPGAYRHPAEAAAEIAGYCAATNQASPAKSYVGAVLTGTVPAPSQRWTDDPVSRDTANKAGIATTKVSNNSIVIDGMVTMYRPASVAVQNNAYRSVRNISILQNILFNHRATWASRPSFTVVEDAALVEGIEKQNVLDVEGVEDINSAMALAWAVKSWLWNATYTQENQVVTIRGLSNGFDITLPIILSVEGVISDTTIEVDISLAVFNL